MSDYFKGFNSDAQCKTCHKYDCMRICCDNLKGYWRAYINCRVCGYKGPTFKHNEQQGSLDLAYLDWVGKFKPKEKGGQQVNQCTNCKYWMQLPIHGGFHDGRCYIDPVPVDRMGDAPACRHYVDNYGEVDNK